MPNFILGTVQFGLDYGINNKIGKPSIDDVNSILDFAYKNKIRFLDTAESYGNCHNIIGNYHKNSKNRFKIITKFNSHEVRFPKNIHDRIECHLNSLKVNSIYSYMFHNMNDFKKYFDSFKSDLLSLKKKGLIKKIGVSLHDNKDMELVLRHKEIELIQLPYNFLDNRRRRDNIIRKAKNQNIEIHTRSVFLQGLFFKDINSLNDKMLIFKKPLKNIKKLIGDNDIHELAIKYAYSNSKIDAIVIGVDSVEQLKKNLSSISKNNHERIFRQIDKINLKEDYMLNPVNW